MDIFWQGPKVQGNLVPGMVVSVPVSLNRSSRGTIESYDATHQRYAVLVQRFRDGVTYRRYYPALELETGEW